MTCHRASLLIVAACLLPLLAACGDDESGSGGAGTTTGAGGAGGAGGSGSYGFTTVQGEFNFPESCFWDPVSRMWYVSNIVPPASGDLTEKDGVGWISRIDEDGVLVDERWAEGFDTPAGIRVHDGVLYVANIDAVLGLDVADGTVVETHQFASAQMLNDPAVDKATGQVYVSDTLGNVLYRFMAGQEGSEEVFVDSPDLTGPNGVLVDGPRIYIVSLADFTTQARGPILEVDLATKAITQVGDFMGKFDGIEMDGDDFLVSDNPTAVIHRVAPDGSHSVAYDLKADHDLITSADIGFDPDRRILCIPDLQGNTVSLLTME